MKPQNTKHIKHIKMSRNELNEKVVTTTGDRDKRRVGSSRRSEHSTEKYLRGRNKYLSVREKKKILEASERRM